MSRLYPFIHPIFRQYPICNSHIQSVTQLYIHCSVCNYLCSSYTISTPSLIHMSRQYLNVYSPCAALSHINFTAHVQKARHIYSTNSDRTAPQLHLYCPCLVIHHICCRWLVSTLPLLCQSNNFIISLTKSPVRIPPLLLMSSRHIISVVLI